MNQQSVFGIAATEEQAVFALQNLSAGGFSERAISALFPDQTTLRDFGHEKHTKAPEGTVSGASTGGLVGGTIGLLAALGTITIPGMGALVAAGPLLSTLSGAAAGAAVGGLVGALVGLGIPEYEAKRYEGKIRDGNILIAVHTESSEEKDRAIETLKRTGIQDIGVGKEVSIDEKKRAA